MTHKKGTDTNHGVSRRKFLERIGQVGGAAALMETMTALGFARNPEPFSGPFDLPKVGNGRSVVVLGGGIGGLTSVYELERAGYTCMLLEGNNRFGGRSFTARRGDSYTEVNKYGEEQTQTCQFDEGLYLNMGPGRLPYHHRRVLHYCDQLGVSLEVYVMNTMANLFQTKDTFGGEPQVYRRMANDTRGYISELLAKAVNRHALDDMLNDADREALLGLLQRFGDLSTTHNGDLAYTGSTRSGCRYPLSVYEDCEPESPIALANLLESRFWDTSRTNFYQPVCYEWQPTLFQPVGGMDMIVHAFVDQISSPMMLNAIVTRIVTTGEQVEVHYTLNGEPQVTTADYCVSNIPLPNLAKIPANFSADFESAIDQAKFDPTCKVGWQANQRFWENNQNQMYGGISWINHNITQMWYPSYDYFTPNGTMTGAYNFSDRAIHMGNLSLEDRLRLAKQGAVQLHPQFADEAIVPTDLGLSIAWQNMPFETGGWAGWDSNSEADRRAYERLLSPDATGRFFVVGDQVSTLPGWQEGAMTSAHHVVDQITGVASKRKRTVKRAPDSRSITQGI